MLTDILLERQPIPSTGALTLRVTVEVAVSAETAQRRVNRFVHMEISTQMHAETPVLVLRPAARQRPERGDGQDSVVGDQAVWRVPVHLTFPAFGDVGCVGSVHVDPVTGELDVSQSVIEEIERNAQNLVARLVPLSRIASAASPAKPRIAGLHRGAIWASDDFDESLSV